MDLPHTPDLCGHPGLTLPTPAVPLPGKGLNCLSHPNSWRAGGTVPSPQRLGDIDDSSAA